MTLITTTKELKSLCTRLKKADFITVDTEFIREKTYYPRLCLIQVAGKDDEPYAIDPLAEGMDISPFFDILLNKEVLKVMHACRQDMEIFYNLMGKLPVPIFDTQVAAMVCGYGEQVSYEVLVSSMLKKRLDKSSRFTDWAMRPLTSKQLKYALADVTHLRKIFIKLADRLEKLGRESWIKDEMKKLSRKEIYVTKPEDAWERIKVPNYKPRTLCLLKEVAAWREKLAQEVDVPRGRIMKDEAIAEIVTHPPATREALSKMRNISKGFAESDRGQDVLDAVQRGLDMDEKDGPVRKPRPQFPPGMGPTIDLLRVLLKLKCEEGDVAPKLLCTAAELEQIAAFGKEAKVPAMSGWRFKIFGKEALEVRDGKLALAVENGKIKLVAAG
ncbi:MAG: ribonuclease D [Alphaproteobacteria bacterium]|nr:ribonuclease D [Alphaproteobacteria bacterium]